ncbi:hypothetical protein [Streptomyces sp. SID12501]|uniref:PLL-like beta propeller domain-containing protein n=1 Tax=Streptomyces sp. SID12501 TaxID=2706042 RepID=A0A6B3BPW7_9ACTN|nr:hypothetical protein [Streptomyces sp. SID12501]NEC86383.1 hypothetical protein [Streptomyces sp. SID12501]
MVVSTTPGADWGTWINLEGDIYAEPAPVLNADNRVWVFVRGGGDTLWSRGELRDRTWSQWIHHQGSRIAGVPSAIRGRDGKVRVFYRTPGNGIEVITQSVINGGFSAPQSLVSTAGGDPVAVLNADGRIQVFFRGSDGALWYVRNQDLKYETYGTLTSLGGAIFASPSPVLDGTGRVVVAVKGASDTLYTIQQNASNSTDSWEPWQSNTGGVTSKPTALLDAAGRVQIFYRGSDQAAWWIGQSNDYENFNTPAKINSGVIDRPTAALGQDGRVNVTVKGTDNALWVDVENEENATAYGAFQSLGGAIGAVDVSPVIANSEGLLYVFTQGSGDAKDLWLQRQNWA